MFIPLFDLAQTAAEAATEAASIPDRPATVMESLKLIGIGWGSIFVVILIMLILVMILNKTTGKKSRTE